MNILFFTHQAPVPTKGGTERITCTIASSLNLYYNCNCFSLYVTRDSCNVNIEKCFIKEYCLESCKNESDTIDNIHQILTENKIDVIIDQGSFKHIKIFKIAISDLNCKLILAHHFEPGAECAFFNLKKLLYSRIYPLTVRCIIRRLKNILLYTYEKKQYNKSLRESYAEAYNYADIVVLLCKEFINSYLKFSGTSDTKKFVIIPNALSFKEFIHNSEIQNKGKIALIVSRLDDTHKRISLAIKIWQKIKRNSIAKDWILKIVGEGPSMNKYKHLVNKNKIPDIYFYGRQDPINFYREAALFFMTSRSESWGLTLTEAQQFGVVPIAFNTYASLNSIIDDHINGIIIDEGNIESYVDEVLELMKDTQKRNEIAQNCIRSCQKFNPKVIAEKWYNLIYNRI